jgi:hypothetical protein
MLRESCVNDGLSEMVQPLKHCCIDADSVQIAQRVEDVLVKALLGNVEGHLQCEEHSFGHMNTLYISPASKVDDSSAAHLCSSFHWDSLARNKMRSRLADMLEYL